MLTATRLLIATVTFVAFVISLAALVNYQPLPAGQLPQPAIPPDTLPATTNSRPPMSRAAWNLFGWAGLAAIVLLCCFLWEPIVRRIAGPGNNLFASILLLGSMVIGITSPLVAAIRSSRLWLLVSLCGVLLALRFFWLLAD
jgi:hypothetical protein